MPAPVPNLPYDVTTVLGRTRFHAADTATDPDPELDRTLFSDAELAYCLLQNGNDPILAAAMALDSAAADAAKISLVQKTEDTATDRRQISADLAARAETLRRLADIAPVIVAPDQVFSTDSGMGQFPGTMTPW